MAGAGSGRTRDGASASSIPRLFSVAVLRVRDEPPNSSLLSSEGAGIVGMSRWSEGSSGQQDTRDNAEPPSLVLLLSAAVLCVYDGPPCSSL